MKKPIIKLENVSKEYRVYKSNGQRLKSVLLGTKSGKAIKALDKVSLEINRGERVAIMGITSSGRTTLLKIIAGITEATGGKVKVRGKVNAIFDLRAGVDNELSGRDNLIIKGTILGMSKKEFKAREQEVIEFAGMSDYMDYQVKTYAAGMAGRLAFALHTSISSDILIIGDTLKVGSPAEKERCLVRLEEYLEKYPETTLLMIGKQIPEYQRFCSRGVVLDEGKVIFDGTVKEGIAFNRKYQENKPKKNKTIKEELEEKSYMYNDEDSYEDMDF